jgi:hypothetical protein
MLQYKSNELLGEIQKKFTEKEKIFQTLLSIVQSLKISDKNFTNIDKVNTRYSGFMKFVLLILFPLFEIKDISHLQVSYLGKKFECKKDVFYEFLKNNNFCWRKFGYQTNRRLLKNVEKSSNNRDNESVKCLILDDTDMPKRGKHFELLSRIYSHVTHSYNHGFKGLFLGYHDGTSFFGLDFSLHGEKGKNKEKPYGLTKKQSKQRYDKQRTSKTPGQQRVNEYFKTKTEMAINMLRTAISQGIRFDYLLVDSWFTNFELVKFIVTRRIKCHFLGMLKKMNTKYNYKGKELNFNEILKSLKHSTKMKRSKKLNCWYYEVVVDFKGINVKILFCRMKKRGNWTGMLTTDTNLDFEKAFEIYATRWTIEVFFKEAKQLLRLGKCESTDFDAQIAHTTICLLQYNLFSVVKRFECYQSLGALFRYSKEETLEITVKERLWLIIVEFVTVFAKYCDFDSDFLLKNIIAENQELINILNFKTLEKSA